MNIQINATISQQVVELGSVTTLTLGSIGSFQEYNGREYYQR